MPVPNVVPDGNAVPEDTGNGYGAVLASGITGDEGAEDGMNTMGVDSAVDRGTETMALREVSVRVMLAATMVFVIVFVEVKYIVVVGSAEASRAA